MKDFFISYTKTDRAWAEWIAWQLEDLGYETIIDIWDFGIGKDFIIEMQKASCDTKHTIVILSPDYFKADYPQPEWTFAFNRYLKKDRKVIPIKVRPMESEDYFNTLSHIDLVGITKQAAKKKLQEVIKVSMDGSRAKSSEEPDFPADAPILVQPAPDRKETSNSTLPSAKECTPEFKAGLVNKVEQAKHIAKLTNNEITINTDRNNITPLAFLLPGEASQWPDALVSILYCDLKRLVKFKYHNLHDQVSPEILFLTGRSYIDDKPEQYLYELLAEQLTCPPNRTDIVNHLAQQKAPHIFYRALNHEESTNPKLVREMLEAWEKLEFPNHAPRHFLVLYYNSAIKPKHIFSWFNKPYSLIDQINRSDTTGQQIKHILPTLTSPNTKHIEQWVEENFESDKKQKTKDSIALEIKQEFVRRKNDRHNSKEYIQRIRVSNHDIAIHHYDLKDFLVNALKKYG